MYSESVTYSGPVGRVLGDGYRIRSLLDGDTFGEYITARSGCWVLGKITAERTVELFNINLNDPRRSIQTAVSIIYDQLNLRVRLQAGGIAFNDSYFRDIKARLGEERASLTEARTNLPSITPEETARREQTEALIWLGTGGDSAIWQGPKQLSPAKLSGQIASLDAVMTRL